MINSSLVHFVMGILFQAVAPVSPQRARTVEKREIVKQTSTEEDRYIKENIVSSYD